MPQDMPKNRAGLFKRGSLMGNMMEHHAQENAVKQRTLSIIHALGVPSDGQMDQLEFRKVLFCLILPSNRWYENSLFSGSRLCNTWIRRTETPFQSILSEHPVAPRARAKLDHALNLIVFQSMFLS